MATIELPIGRQAFVDDPHAATYLSSLDETPTAFEHLLAILNRRHSVDLMLHESSNGNAALRGILDQIEADPLLVAAIVGPAGRRFRQAIGVAIRIKMEVLGWSTTGLKGPVGGHFSRAEKYCRNAEEGTSAAYRDRALRALESVADMGTPEEQRESGAFLMEALRTQRAAEGRPF